VTDHIIDPTAIIGRLIVVRIALAKSVGEGE